MSIVQSNNNSSFITYAQVIRQLLNQEDLTQRHYAKFIPLVKRIYGLIYRKALPNVKTELLTFKNPNIRVIDLPWDYAHYTKIGMIVQLGPSANPVFMTMSLNHRLHKLTNEEIVAANCDCDTSDDITTNITNLTNGLMPFDQYTLFRNVIRGNQVVGELYGAGNGVSALGTYIEDRENWRFVFGNEVPTDAIIAVEYKSTGAESGPDTRIPLTAQEAMMKGLQWLMLNHKNSSIFERDKAEKMFYNEVKQLYRTLNNPTLSEILDVLERSSRLLRHN